jgi:hypothetical protein
MMPPLFRALWNRSMWHAIPEVSLNSINSMNYAHVNRMPDLHTIRLYVIIFALRGYSRNLPNQVTGGSFLESQKFSRFWN